MVDLLGKGILEVDRSFSPTVAQKTPGYPGHRILLKPLLLAESSCCAWLDVLDCQEMGTSPVHWFITFPMCILGAHFDTPNWVELMTKKPVNLAHSNCG